MPRFPLRIAYPFGSQHNLHMEMQDIRAMAIHWDLSYSSTVRRGYVIELFRQHGLMEEFLEARWPAGNLPTGRSEIAHSLHVKNQYESERGLARGSACGTGQ